MVVPARLTELFAARHSCESPEWYTPAPIVEAARRVLGGIDLDPASSDVANQIVRAARYFTADDDGLRQAWTARSVFVNPPGGLVPQFWDALLRGWCQQTFACAIWIGYSLEQLQTLQSRACTPLAFPFCVPQRRIAFVENEGRRVARIEKQRAAGAKPKAASSPSHGNYICYLGSEPARFVQAFRPLGCCVVPGRQS